VNDLLLVLLPLVLIVVVVLWLRSRLGTTSAEAAAQAPVEIRALDLGRPVEPGQRVTYNQQVAGAHHRAETVWALAQRLGARRKSEVDNLTFRVLLVPEPGNEHDPNAIRVLSEAGEHLGFIPAEWAARYKPTFDLMATHGYVGSCPARFVAPSDDWPDIAIDLTVRPPRGLLKDIQETFAGPVPIVGHRTASAALKDAIDRE
jgi:hypothetical protein